MGMGYREKAVRVVTDVTIVTHLSLCLLSSEHGEGWGMGYELTSRKVFWAYFLRLPGSSVCYAGA